MLNILEKYRLFINLKKFQFYKNKVYFLDYIILILRVKIKDKKIKVVKNWLKPKSIQDFQIFKNFTNFYQGFI